MRLKTSVNGTVSTFRLHVLSPMMIMTYFVLYKSLFQCFENNVLFLANNGRYLRNRR